MKCKCAECGITKYRFVKGSTTKAKKGRGLLLGKNSPFNKIPIIGAILSSIIKYRCYHIVLSNEK